MCRAVLCCRAFGLRVLKCTALQHIWLQPLLICCPATHKTSSGGRWHEATACGLLQHAGRCCWWRRTRCVAAHSSQGVSLVYYRFDALQMATNIEGGVSKTPILSPKALKQLGLAPLVYLLLQMGVAAKAGLVC